MRRSKLRKESKLPIAKLQRLLWEEVKRIVRARYPHDCYTCPAKGLDGSNLQTGHGPWPKGALGAYLKYDLRCVRPQCMRCNIHLGGMGAEFYARMLSEIGPKAMRKLEQDRNVSVKAYDHYLRLLSEYRALDR